MDVLVSSDDTPAEVRLTDSLRRMRMCGDVQVAELDRVIDDVARAQPDLTIIRLSDESAQKYHTLVRQLHEVAAGRIVVVGPAVDAKLLLKFFREGAFHYIDEADFKSEFESVLTRMHDEPRQQISQGRIISVIGGGGGCGVSTLAVNTAAELCRQHRQVAMIDLKLESGDLANLLNLRPKHFISDFCRNASRMDRSLFDSCLTPHSSGIQLLAAPSSAEQIKEITIRGIRRLLCMARNQFPYVVIDVGQPFRREHELALDLADAIILTLRLEFSSLHNASRALDFLAHSNVSPRKIRAVANRYRRGQGVSLADAETALGMPVAHVLPDDPRRVASCNDRGVPVVTEKRRSLFAKRICQMAHSVNGVPINK